ncbi:MAG: hypothetical protein AAGE13_08645 [Pseudomonadota bacterium]
MSRLGHNGGPAFDAGVSWRRHCWRKARAQLLPRLPLEVVRLRVARARQIGLDYTRYATVRATTGRDVVAFLFSTNALRLMREEDRLAEARAARLSALIGCSRRLAVYAPIDLDALVARLAAQGVPVEAAIRAPTAALSPSATGRALRAALAPGRVPRDGVLVVGDTPLEARWPALGGFAGYVPAEVYFAPQQG